MYLQENTLFDLDLKSHNFAIYAPAKFEVAKSNSFGDAFTRKYIRWPWAWLGSRSHKTLYIMNYAPVKFEVATSNG